MTLFRRLEVASELVAIVVLLGCWSSTAPASRDSARPVGCLAIGPRLSPATFTIAPGDTLRLTVFPPPCVDPAVGTQVVFSSSNAAVAHVESASGLVTGVSHGDATITARLVLDPAVVAAALATVTP